MDAGKLVAKILVAISSGGDLYLYDQYIIGPNAKQRAREVLIEKMFDSGLGASADEERRYRKLARLEAAGLPGPGRVIFAIILGWTLGNWLRKSSLPSARVATSICMISTSLAPTPNSGHARC